MESKICSLCNIEKHINIFYKIYSDCKDCNSKRGLKRCYEKKDKISNQRKICHEKNKHTILQKQNDRYIHFREIFMSSAELENKLEAMEEISSRNDSRNK